MWVGINTLYTLPAITEGYLDCKQELTSNLFRIVGKDYRVKYIPFANVAAIKFTNPFIDGDFITGHKLKKLILIQISRRQIFQKGLFLTLVSV